MITIHTKESGMNTSLKIMLAVLLLVLIAALSSCENNHVEEALPAGAINPCDTAIVKLNSDLIPILTEKCASSGCHDGSNDPDLSANIYTNLEPSLSNGNFKTRVLDERSMPQDGSPTLTAAEYLKIKCWYENGHSNN